MEDYLDLLKQYLIEFRVIGYKYANFFLVLIIFAFGIILWADVTAFTTKMCIYAFIGILCYFLFSSLRLKFLRMKASNSWLRKLINFLLRRNKLTDPYMDYMKKSTFTKNDLNFTSANTANFRYNQNPTNARTPSEDHFYNMSYDRSNSNDFYSKSMKKLVDFFYLFKLKKYPCLAKEILASEVNAKLKFI